MKKKLIKLLQIIRYLPIAGLVHMSDKKLVADLKRWKLILQINDKDWVALSQILWYEKQFRNLVLYRNSKRLLFRILFRLIYPPMKSLYIDAKEIGGGLFIQHGFSTMIAAESIGENCWINQQVTIGYSGKGRPPIIGNNVMITCGAKVLGSITVGNDVVIGANAVVVKDVEEKMVMVGIPAHPLKKLEE